MNVHIENHVRDNLPAGVKTNEYHRVVTVALLLPADEDRRNAIIAKLAPPESIGGMQILDVRHGSLASSWTQRAKFLKILEGFGSNGGNWAMQHNQTLALRQEEQDQVKQRPSAVPMLRPWNNMMLSLRTNLLGVAIALAAIVILQNIFE